MTKRAIWLIIYCSANFCCFDSFAWCQGTTDDKEEQTAPKDRSTLRFATRSFDEWKETLRFDLDLVTRQRAVDAIATFAVHGYADESFIEITTALKNDNSQYVRQSAFEALGRFLTTRPTDVLQHVLDRIKTDGVAQQNSRQIPVETQIVKSLLNSHCELTAKRLAALVGSDDATVEARLFGCRQLIDWQTVQDDSGKVQETFLPAAVIADDAIHAFLKLAVHDNTLLRSAALRAFGAMSIAFRSSEFGTHYKNPKANLYHFQCAQGLKERVADTDDSIRELAVSIIAANGIKQPDDLTQALLAELNNQTKSIQETMARFEDPSSIWTAAERSIPGNTRNGSNNPMLPAGTLKLDYTINLIRALGLQQEHGVVAVPLLKTLKESLAGLPEKPPARNSNTRSGPALVGLTKKPMTLLINQALGTIDGTNANGIEQLKSQESVRTLIMSRLRSGAQSNRGGFGSQPRYTQPRNPQPRNTQPRPGQSGASPFGTGRPGNR